MKVLITGAGLIGTYTAEELLAKGHKVTLVDVNPPMGYIKAIINTGGIVVKQLSLENHDEITNQIAKIQPDVIIHTAGLMKRLMEKDSWLGFKANVMATAALFGAAQGLEVKKIVFISSLSVYDFSHPATDIIEEHPTSPCSIYDHSKLIAESWLRAVFDANTTQLTILRLAGTYGAGLYRGGAWMGKQLQDLLLPVASNQTSQITLDASAFGVNEYLYVKDAAQAICLAAESPLLRETPLICNVGSGKLTSATQLAEAIKSLFPQVEVNLTEFSANKPDYLRRVGILSLDKIKKELNYVPRYGDIEKGLKDYIGEIQKLKKFGELL